MKNCVAAGFKCITDMRKREQQQSAPGAECRPLADDLRAARVLAYREIESRLVIRSLEASASRRRSIRAPDAVLQVDVAEPDYGLWFAKRIGAYKRQQHYREVLSIAFRILPYRAAGTPLFS